MDDSAIFVGRAATLRDLEARGLASAAAVSVLDEVCSQRRWWLEQWAEGAPYVPGLIAQDVQDGLADRFGRESATGLWPVCRLCAEGPVHALHIAPELGGPDPMWVCEETGTEAAALGDLGRTDERDV